MKKNRIFPVIVVSLVLTAAFLLSGCQEAFLIQGVDLAAQPEGIESFSLKEPEDLMAYRWVEMAKWYEKEDRLNREMDAGDLMAYRWNAMAQAFEQKGQLNYHNNPDDLLAYRWQAMADSYERAGLLNHQLDADDLLAYRWQAMAEAYQKLGLLNTP